MLFTKTDRMFINQFNQLQKNTWIVYQVNKLPFEWAMALTRIKKSGKSGGKKSSQIWCSSKLIIPVNKIWIVNH